MQNPKLVSLFLRISIASVFIYAAIAATLVPNNWIGYIPQIATHIFPAELLLVGFSIFQAALAAWILSGWKLFYASIISAITIAAIIVANIYQIDILFRDLAILFAAIALGVGSSKKR